MAFLAPVFYPRHFSSQMYPVQIPTDCLEMSQVLLGCRPGDVAGLRTVVLEEHCQVLSVSLVDLCLTCLNVAAETDVAVHLCFMTIFLPKAAYL